MASLQQDGGEATSIPASASSKPPSSITRQPSSFTRQASIYSLRLDEFQNALGDPGKSFGSTNMDEFLKNIWTAEESQAIAVVMGTNGDAVDVKPTNQGWQQPNVQHEGSISLLRTQSPKTVEGVWKDSANTGIDMGSGADPPSGSRQERQPTFGEMTLEDFLMKAGVNMKDNGLGSQSLAPFGMNFDSAFNSAVTGNDDITERIGHGSAFFSYRTLEDEKPILEAPMVNIASRQNGLESIQHSKPGLDWLTNKQFRNTMGHANQPQGCHPRHIMQSKGLTGNGGLMGQGVAGLGVLAESAFLGPDLGVGLGGAPGPLAIKTDSSTSPISDGVGPSHGAMSSLSPLPYGLDGPGGGRKRGYEGTLEKVVERRQRRMIKNRESAARSRARKQAYTVELEAEVMQLKEENLRLRLLQEEIADKQRKQFMDALTSLGQHVAPKAHTLRRTRTVPW